MGRLVICSLLTAQASLLLQALRNQLPRFQTLEECEEAYDKLLGVPADVVAEPEYETTTTTTTAAPVTTTTTSGPRKPKAVGEPMKTEAKEAYIPPNSGGVPSTVDGWDYQEHGDDWSELPNGASCAGEAQSPIDIVKYVDIGGQTKSVMWFDYYADPELKNTSIAELRNDGHGIYLAGQQLDLGYVKNGDAEWVAKEYDFHAPAEHTLDGQVFPLEMQIMHKDASGKNTLAVSVLFKYGHSNPYLAALLAASNGTMPVWSKKGSASMLVSGVHADFFDLEAVLPSGKHVHPGKDLTFYNYPGSLTSPPCSEGVDWWVTAEPVDATKEEIAEVRKAILAGASTKKGNNRNAQPMNKRKVLVGHTGFQHHIKAYGHKKDGPHVSRGYATQDLPWQNATHWTAV
jgi:carbonic anhydrase